MRMLFVCVGNSCRSQMAESIANSLGHDAFSAGTEPSTEVSKNAILVLEEQGYPTQGLAPKSIDDLFPGDFDLIISMGCGVSCPNVPIDHDWGLDDPVGGSIEIFRQTRDEILKLIQAIQPD